MDERNLQFGLRPLPPDPRDFSLGAVFTLPKLSELPAEFVLEPLTIKNQFDTDMCTAFATCGASELQEGVELCPEYSFALSKFLTGDPDAWGQDLRTAMKAHVKFGAIQEQHIPDAALDSKMRRIENWSPDLKTKALEHAKSSFMKVEPTNGMDVFDTIRATIHRFPNEKKAPVIGIKWGWPLSDQVLLHPNGGIGHAVYVLGWKQVYGEPYLIIQNSWGSAAGENGRHYVSREVINEYVSLYGAFIFTDMTKEEYLARLKPAIQYSILGILKDILNILLATLRIKQEEAPEILIPAVEPNRPVEHVEPNPDNSPPFKTARDYRDLALTVAKEVGLSDVMTDRFIRTIDGETAGTWNPNLKVRNPNGTYDYGLAQLNSYWYIGPGKPCPSIEKAYDPEFALRLMAKQFKAGRATDWIVYRRLYGFSKVGSPKLAGMQIPDWLLSSTGEGVATRWKSFASGVIPTLLLVAPLFGFHPTADIANEFVELVARLLIAVWEFGSVLFLIVGWYRAHVMKRNLAGKYSPTFSRRDG